MANRRKPRPDQKERWLIAQVHETIRSGSYSERDVLCLLILLRRHAADGSAALEFAHFVAHREKDRGILKTYLDQIHEAFHGKLPSSEHIQLPVFSVQQIGSSLNEVLATFGLEPFSDETANQIVVCIIALLQDVSIETVQKVPVSSLAMAISKKHIALMGHSTVPAGHVFEFPLLIAENHNYESSVARSDSPEVEFFTRFDFIVKASCTGGIFRVQQTLPRLVR